MNPTSTENYPRHHSADLLARVAIWFGALFFALPLLAGLPSSEVLTYQGRLLENNTPFTGTVDMEFDLWTAPTNGTLVDSQSINGVSVVDGLFQVELLFGSEAYEDGLWLQVIADGASLTPRQRIGAVPLALHALNGGGGGFWELSGGFLQYNGPVSITANAQDALTVNGDVIGLTASADGSAIVGQSGAGIGVQGIVTSSAAVNRGVLGTSFSENGVGVFANNLHPTGVALRAEGFVGVRSDADSTGVFTRGGDTGIYAESPNVAVFGAASDPDGYAGYFTGDSGSTSYFGHPVGIADFAPTAMLEINGPGVNGNGRALRVSVNDDEKFVIGNLGTSILQPVFIEGTLALTNFVGGGAIDVCRTGSPGFAGQLAACSSSARYKRDVVSVDSATDLIDQLRPVTFRWTESGEEDYGFVAEEVAAIEPRLATYNAEGQVEGVKYRQLSAVLIRALQEQREETALLNNDIHALRVDLEAAQELTRQNQLLTQRIERLESLLLSDRSVAHGD